jgi:plastocyanin
MVMSGRLRALYLILLLTALVPRTRAAEWFVDIYDYYFTPTNLVVNQGDTVTWINRGLQAHDTTALDGSWVSELLYNEEQPFSFTFTNAGPYPYICLKHIDEYPDQTGLVVVASVNLPPGVQITNPPNGGVFAAPASFILGAEANDDGEVVSVEFFLNGLSLGSITTPPYVTNVSGLGTNNYTFTAIATDNEGATGTSVVNIVVQEAPPSTFTLVFSVTPPNTGVVLVSPPPIDGFYFAGATVALAAQPAAGFRFAHWIGDVAPSATTNNPLLLLMNSDKNVVAVFEPIPPLNFGVVGGRYLGLLIDESTTNYVTSGFVSLRVSKSGSYQGTATIGGITSVMRGQFDRLGYAPLVLRRASLSGSLQIDPDRQRMTGFITDGRKSPTLTLYRTAASTNAGLLAGHYTLAFSPGAPVPSPGGGAVRILSGDGVRLRGVLGDGNGWSDQTFLSPDARIPVFTRLYHNRGALLGWLTVATDGSITGDLRWFRPPDSRSTRYPDGLVLKMPVTGIRAD